MNKNCVYENLIKEGLGFKSGSANQATKTRLEGKIKIIDRQSLSRQDQESFAGGDYYTAVTLEPLIFYQVYGQSYTGVGAWPRGRFVTTEYAESIIDVKIRLALKPEWKNTRLVEARICVPVGTVINVGLVAAVDIDGGTTLGGGADQIMLPNDWPESWIIGYRRIRWHPQLTYPEYDPIPLVAKRTKMKD